MNKLVKPPGVRGAASGRSPTWRGRRCHDELGANPIEEITHETGVWTLRFLC